MDQRVPGAGGADPVEGLEIHLLIVLVASQVCTSVKTHQLLHLWVLVSECKLSLNKVGLKKKFIPFLSLQ